MNELEDRAAALTAHEGELRAQEARLDARLGEFDERHAELQRTQAELDAAAARVSQREQAVVLKVRELTIADEQRAAATAELTKQLEGIAERERLLARAEAGNVAQREELGEGRREARPARAPSASAASTPRSASSTSAARRSRPRSAR